MRLECRARVSEVLHICLEEAHVRRGFLVDAQEVDADVPLLVRRHPTLDGGVDLELFQLVLRDGVKARNIAVADALRDLVHALLFVKLELGHALDETEGETACTHLVNRRLQSLRCTEGLLPREHNRRDCNPVHA